ncbi:MAG: CPBP family intramembrane metalloprotease [Acidobacteria bacterium]|nr:MAG: CPBP family intramembrane metalloprotease [Acidobacteriota bacterium]
MRKGFLQNGSVRPFARLLISVAGITVAVAIAAIGAGSMPVALVWLPAWLVLLFWFSLLLLPALLGLYTMLTRHLDGRPLGSVGFAFHPRWKSELCTGLVAGTVMMMALAGAQCLVGIARFAPASGPPGRTVLSGVFLLLTFVVAAADEELLFRGYPFQRLVDVGSPVFAVALLSVLFGPAHLHNPSQTWISTLNTVMVGVMLAICYLRTRSLWLAFGRPFCLEFCPGVRPWVAGQGNGFSGWHSPGKN